MLSPSQAAAWDADYSDLNLNLDESEVNLTDSLKKINVLVELSKILLTLLGFLLRDGTLQ